MGKSKELFMEIRAIEDAALAGEMNELEAYLVLNRVKVATDQAMKSIKQYAFDEFEKHDQKTVSLNGCSIQKSQSGRYSYRHIQEWNELNDKVKVIEKKSQEAYKMALKGVDLIEEGVIVEPAEYKENEPSLRISIEK